MHEKLLKGLVRLIRPYWWAKTFLFMTLGATMAVKGLPDLFLFLLGFLIIGPLLWGGLYTLNDLSDIHIDRYDYEKRNRSFASGIISPGKGLIFAVLLITTSLIAGFIISRMFFLCIIVMIVNQFVYTFKPLRLKRMAFFDVFSGAIIASLFRFFSGWFLFSDSFDIPLLMIIALISFKSGGYLLYKLRNKNIDLKFNYKTTVVLLPERAIKFISNSLIGLGLLSILFLPINSIMFKNLDFLGILPFRFFWLILGILILTPFYWIKFKKTEGVFIIQTLVYLSYLIVSILFMILYAF